MINDSEPDALDSKFEGKVAGVKFMTLDDLGAKLEESGFEIKEIKRMNSRSYFISSVKP